MRKGSMLGITLAALALMESMPKLDGLGSSPLAPDIEGLKLPDTSDVAKKFLERDRAQRAKFPSRKQRFKAKARRGGKK